MKKKIILIVLIVIDIVFLSFITYLHFSKDNTDNSKNNIVYHIYKVNNGNDNYTFNVTKEDLSKEYELFKDIKCSNNCKVYFPYNLKYTIIKDNGYYIYDFISDIKTEIKVKDEYTEYYIYRTSSNKEILILKNDVNTTIYSLDEKKILYSDLNENLNYSYASLYNNMIILNNKIIDIETNKIINTLKEYDNAKYQIAGTSNKYYILLLNKDTGKMKIFDKDMNQLNINFDQLAFDDNGNIITTNDNKIIIYDEKANILKTSKQYDNISFVFNDMFIAVENGILKVFDLDFKELNQITKFEKNYTVVFQDSGYIGTSKELKIVILTQDKTLSFIYNKENNEVKEVK